MPFAFGPCVTYRVGPFFWGQRLAIGLVQRALSTYLVDIVFWVAGNKNFGIGHGGRAIKLFRFFRTIRGVCGTMGDVYMLAIFNNRGLCTMGYAICWAIAIGAGRFRTICLIFWVDERVCVWVVALLSQCIAVFLWGG